MQDEGRYNPVAQSGDAAEQLRLSGEEAYARRARYCSIVSLSTNWILSVLKIAQTCLIGCCSDSRSRHASTNHIDKSLNIWAAP